MPRPIAALAALVCLLVPAAARAQQATLTDDASTWVGQAPDAKRRGTSLQVSGAADRTFLKFDFASVLPDGIASRHVASARLRLFVSGVAEPGQIAVHRAVGEWTERTVTHPSAPELGPIAATFDVDADAAGRWIAVDLTGLVKEWIDGSVVNDGLALVGLGTTTAEFDSKENRETSHEPRLDVVLANTATTGVTGRVDGGTAMSAGDPSVGVAALPDPGSPFYIQNTTVQQPDADFHISGTGTAGALSAGTVNAGTAFALGGVGVLRIGGIGAPFGESLYIGRGAGVNSGVDVGVNTFVGFNSGTFNTTGTQNAFFGSNAGHRNATGGQNAFFGDGAGFSNTASANAFFGFLAGFRNSSAVLNSFFGVHAGRETTTGCCNSFFGNFAGVQNTTGWANAFFGGSAGAANTTGLRNAFFGDLAGYDLATATGNSTGSFNTFVGSESGKGVTTGSHNTFVGHNTQGAGMLEYATAVGADAQVTTSNTIMLGRAVDRVVAPGGLSASIVTASVQYNIGNLRALGVDAQFNTSVGPASGLANGGRNNTNVGFQAGQNGTGIANVFIGNRTGRIETGNSNTFVGSIAGELHAAGSDNTFVGDGAGAQHTAGGENAYFGVDAGRGSAATDASRNSFFGTLAGRNVLAGTDNSTFGYRAGFGNATGSSNTLLGAGADVGMDGLLFATALGAGAVVEASNTVVLGRPADSVRVPGSLAIAGAFTAAAFAGNGAALTNLDAGNITSGVLASERLGPVVRGVNGLTGQVALAAGAHITITPAGNTLTIESTAPAVNAILNQSFPQLGATFNIDGTGAAGAFDAATQYRIGGTHALSTGNANVFAGAGAGQLTVPSVPNPISGTNNAFFGHNAGAANVEGSQNAFFGAEAGASLRDREANSFFGFQSGKNTLASANSFFGYQSGLENVMGVSNAFFGFQAGQFNRDGSSNTFVGFRAGFRNQASANAFFGHDAGRENTTGFGNSYFGAGAGQNIVEGSDNAIFGASAGATFSVTASRNAIFGAWAGLSNRGSDNVFVGADAGRLSIDGSGHTFVGAGAGRILQSGVANTAIGFNAQAAEGVTNATAIGAHSVVSQSDSVAIGSWNARVGIGIDAPREKLEVLGGNVLVGSPGAGIILKSPDGNTCAMLALDNAGALSVSPVACP